jgi:multiple antibiotic resistance protein
VGVISIVISLREKAGHIQSEKGFFSGRGDYCCLFFLGEKILVLLGIDVNSFAVAGSFMIIF